MRNVLVLLFTALSITVLIGCTVSVPIREMTDAKTGIKSAEKVKADKYAPNELGSAQAKLIESHGQVAGKDADKAKTSAVEAADLALAAYNKSLPLLAKDTIEIADKSLDEAGEVYAERLAPAEYRDAEDALKQANDQFQDKQYAEAYQSAVRADEKAKNARNIAIGKNSLLGDSIAEVKRTLEEAEQYGAKKYAPEKVRLASENLVLAEEAYKEQELKKGFSAVEVAKLNADEALLEALKKTAADRLAEAKKAIALAEKSKFAGQRSNELNAAKESLESAKSKLADSKYKDSIADSDEALRLAYLVMGRKPDGTEVAAAVEETTPVEEQVAEEKDYWEYRVVYRERYKDCLWYIAKKYYGNGMLWKKIYKYNKDLVRNPNLIYPGWIIKVPKLKK
ncbi:MAG: DUF4398 domain-containing protein [Spirochaetes bacterium]|nr:DUF4398 domain-containing protein [Spirochaetota bacterium]